MKLKNPIPHLEFPNLGDLPQLEHPNWKIGIMEYWNDGVRRKTKNLLFPILIPIIPLFQQSTIPILQKISLMDNGVLQKLRELQIPHTLT